MLFNYSNKILKILSILVINFSVQASGNSIPEVWHVPGENLNFTGREDALAMIKNIFQTSDLKAVVISGPSGFGKTQVAKKYAHQNYGGYDVVWWFKGNQYLEPQLESFALALSPYLGLDIIDNIKKIGPGRLISLIKDALRKKNAKCLIIFDDVQAFKDIEPYIPFTHMKNVHVIITTKNANLSLKSIQLKSFKRDESIAFINHFLPEEDARMKESLARCLGDCPASLAVAIDYIKNYPRMTIASYLQKHNTEAESSSQFLADAAQRLGSTMDGYELDLFRGIKMNIEELKLKSQRAFCLVAFLSLLHHDAIAAETIQKWIQAQQNNNDPAELISLVNQYSFLDTTSIDDKSGNLRMHELIQKIVGSLIPVEEKKKQIEIAVDILKESFSDRTDEIVERIIKDNTPLLHAMKVSEEADKINYHSPSLTSLRIKAFDVLVGHVRDHEQSKIMLGHLERDMTDKPRLSKEDEIIYNTTRFLYSLVFSPDYENGIAFGKKAQELIEAEEGMPEEKIRLYSNLLQYCSLTGQLENSQTYVTKGEDCLPISKSDAYNALFIFAVSMYQNDCGEYDKTINLINENQPLLDRQDSYPSMRFFILNQLAEAYVKKGKIDESLEVLDRGEKFAREFYPNEDNSFFGRCYLLKGLCHLAKPESHGLAKESLDKALIIFDKIYLATDKHRNQAYTHLILGKYYYLQKQYDQAKEHLLISEKIYDKLLKSKKIEDVSELYKWLSLLGVDSKDEVLTHTYLKKQISTFGLDHSRTKEIAVYLDEKGLSLPF